MQNKRSHSVFVYAGHLNVQGVGVGEEDMQFGRSVISLGPQMEEAHFLKVSVLNLLLDLCFSCGEIVCEYESRNLS